MKIKYEDCRCHDNECDEKEECARWVDRDGGTSTTPHACLYPYDIPFGGPCYLKIEIEDN